VGGAGWHTPKGLLIPSTIKEEAVDWIKKNGLIDSICTILPGEEDRKLPNWFGIRGLWHDISTGIPT